MRLTGAGDRGTIQLDDDGCSHLIRFSYLIQGGHPHR